jgi:ferredoxin
MIINNENYLNTLRKRKMKITVDPKKCNASGACVAACPENAISVADGVAQIDENTCDMDGMCIPACPNQAIGYKEGHDDDD